MRTHFARTCRVEDCPRCVAIAEDLDSDRYDEAFEGSWT